MSTIDKKREDLLCFTFHDPFWIGFFHFIEKVAPTRTNTINKSSFRTGLFIYCHALHILMILRTQWQQYEQYSNDIKRTDTIQRFIQE